MVSEGVTVAAAIIVVELVDIGGDTLVKSANTEGMSIFIFVVYSNLFALCFLLPSSLFYHRKRAPPPISTSIFGRFILLSCIRTAVQILMYTGIGYSSPTLASVMMDLVPAFTLLLAVISRMEILNLKQHRSQVKVISILFCIAGALTVTLYKGMPLIGDVFTSIEMWTNGINILDISDWIVGAFLLATATFFLSVLFIVQTWIIKDYPEELFVTTICCSIVVILSSVVALMVEGNSSAWILRLDKKLVSMCYTAIFIVSTRNIVNAWACRKKGPMFVAIFNPLRVVIALGMGVIFLGDNLYLGSMIGAAIIVIGFYGVMWAQAEEKTNILSSYSSPLLSTKA